MKERKGEERGESEKREKKKKERERERDRESRPIFAAPVVRRPRT